MADRLINVRVTRSGRPLDFGPGEIEQVLRAGGQRVTDDLRDNYRLQDADEPNRFVREGTGTRRVHFWTQVADSVQDPEVGGNAVRIRIADHRMKQKLYGGTIHAKNVRYLTIPIHPEAYARRAAETASIVGGLFVVRKKDGRLFLAGRGSGPITFYYRLKESVTQAPWKTALPSVRWLKESFRNGARYWLSRFFRRGGQ